MVPTLPLWIPERKKKLALLHAPLLCSLLFRTCPLTGVRRSRVIGRQLLALDAGSILDALPLLPRALHVKRVPPLHLLLVVLTRQEAEMVQRDARVRHGLARPGQADAVVAHAQLANVAASVLQVERVHASAVEVGGLDEAFHHRVVVVDGFVAGGIVEAPPEVGADAACRGLVGQVGGSVHEPVEGDGADGGVGIESMEEGDERFFLPPVGGGRMVACHGQEFVSVEEAKPFVLMTVPFMAVRVHGVLHGPFTFGAVEVMKRHGRVRYAPFPGALGCG